MDLKEIDFLESVRERNTEEFKDKTVIDKYLQLMTMPLQEAHEQIKKMLVVRDIDVAVGLQLDVIGRIVGINRLLNSFDLYEYFGFEGELNADTFGSVSNEEGGFFKSLNSAIGGDFLLSDEAYRFFIKAQVIKNSTASTPDQLLDFMSFLFGADTKVYYRGGGATMTILFGRELDSFERNILLFYNTEQGYRSRFIIKTLGVGVNFGTFDQNNFFAFQGFPNAKGFGELKDSYGYDYGNDFSGRSLESSGGKLATLLR